MHIQTSHITNFYNVRVRVHNQIEVKTAIFSLEVLSMQIDLRKCQKYI